MALQTQRNRQRQRPEPLGIFASIFRIFLVVGFTSLIVGTVLYGYIADIRIVILPFLGVGFNAYGFYTVVYLSLQMLFARRNVQKINRRRLIAETQRFTPIVGSSSVGAKEDPHLFEQNVRSIADDQDYPNRRACMFVSDGNQEPEDLEMAAAFTRAVGDRGIVITTDYVLWEGIARTVVRYINTHDIMIRNIFGFRSPLRIRTIGALRKKHWRILTRELHAATPWQALKMLLETEACDERADLYQRISRYSPRIKYFMIMQPHRDKRHALFTSMYVLMDYFNSEIMTTTDSDTKYYPNTVSELVKVFSMGRTGGVSGDVKIFDPFHPFKWLPFLSSLRYVMANNLERAAQSLRDSVSCLSGPNSAYASDAMKEIIIEWMMQRFFGARTTYGDDRHWTNLLLKYGWGVNYTPYAICETESPERFWRWFWQQVRWSRSFFREAILNFFWMFRVRRLLWLTFNLTHDMMFPFLLVTGVMIGIVISIETHSLTHIIVWITYILLGGLIRGIYGFFITNKKLRMLLFPFYSFLVLPLLVGRMIAFFTLWYTGWGSRFRGALRRRTTRHNRRR